MRDVAERITIRIQFERVASSSNSMNGSQVIPGDGSSPRLQTNEFHRCLIVGKSFS